MSFFKILIIFEEDIKIWNSNFFFNVQFLKTLHEQLQCGNHSAPYNEFNCSM